MNHEDHVRLIVEGVAGAGKVWAELGSGSGAFTLALADCLGPGAEIHSIDRDGRALRAQAESMRRAFPETVLLQYRADFTNPPALPPLDGVLAANSLHFVQDKHAVLRQIYELLKPGGRLIVVEYGTDRGNRWVPYPMSYDSFHELAERAGFRSVRRLGSRPSRFLGEIYGAMAFRGDPQA